MAEITITSNNFEDVVLKAEKPVLVDFWATWCGPCGMMAPVVEAIAKEMEDRLVVGKVNCDENMELAQSYQITGIPAFLVFNKGEVVGRVVGAMSKDELIKEIQKYI